MNTIPFAKLRALTFVLGLSLFLFAGLWNIGFIATDDYTNGIEIMVPAQVERSLLSIASYTHNPPTPRLLMYFMAKAALKLGITTPADQVRFVFSLIGVFGFIVTFFSLSKLLDFYTDEKKDLRKLIGLLLFSFYFLCPLFSSRVLVESFALPYLVFSTTLTALYYKERKVSFGVLSLIVLALGSLMRFQLGICALVIFAVPLFIKRLKDYLPLLFTSALLFVVTGLYDQMLTGSFHGGLKSYFFYNLNYVGAHYGHQPFYVFIGLFLLLSLPPTFFKRWKDFPWKREYGPLLIPFAVFVLFVALHSLSPHKEERFMIPVLPLFLLLLTPLMTQLWVQKNRWRLAYFTGLNLFLLFFTTVEIPQKNIVFLMTYLDKHSEITSLVGVKDTLVIYPEAFLRNKVQMSEAKENLSNLENINCASAIAIREDHLPLLATSQVRLTPIRTFSPGLLERIVVKLNPKYNFRRAAITLYRKADCENLAE